MERIAVRPPRLSSVKRIIEMGLNAPGLLTGRIPLVKAARVLTGSLRLLPDFLIIGAEKGGTTSLYHYLSQHPNVVPAWKKEIHFFNRSFRKGSHHYRAYFATRFYKNYLERARKCQMITGEGTPDYIFHPRVPQRVLAILPQVKLIVMLRNPIDRAYSNYQHQVRRGLEPLSFEAAIEQRDEELALELNKMMKDEYYFSLFYRRYAYLTKGIYVDQLKPWLDLFPKEQLLILKSEDFYTNPAPVLGKVLQFLGLPEWEPKKYRAYLQASYLDMAASTRQRLADYYEPHNQRLYEYLGENFGWEE